MRSDSIVRYLICALSVYKVSAQTCNNVCVTKTIVLYPTEVVTAAPSSDTSVSTVSASSAPPDLSLSLSSNLISVPALTVSSESTASPLSYLGTTLSSTLSSASSSTMSSDISTFSTAASSATTTASLSSFYNATTPAVTTSGILSNSTTSATTTSIISSSSYSNSSSTTASSASTTSSSSTSADSCISPTATPTISTLTLGGNTFVYHGIVGGGYVASDLVDEFGDTLGGWGSAISIDRNSWTLNEDGTYSGVLYGQPDRGWNTQNTVNFQGRHHTFDITLTPYFCSEIPEDASPNQLIFDYVKSTLYTGPNGEMTTGLDATEVLTVDGVSYPAAYIDSNDSTLGASVDCEGMVHIPSDQSFWISDEYGPYIYHFANDGSLLHTIVPPKAYLPYKDDELYFSSEEDVPDTGREPNRGFEGLTVSNDYNTLYAMLQSALVQDGGDHNSRDGYTRLLRYDISDPASPVLTGEFVVELPIYDDPTKGSRVAAASDFHYLNDHQFLVLPHGKGGYGGTDDASTFRKAQVFDISNATNIAGTSFDDQDGSVNPDGKKPSSEIVTATTHDFIDYNIDDELAKVGYHNGDPDNQYDLYEKWESFALVPTYLGDNDYFLFTVSDNDFITQNGSMSGTAYSDASGLNVPIQALVFWVTLADEVSQ